MPRNPEIIRGYTREAMPRGVPTDSATENKPPFEISNLKFQSGKGEKVR